MSTNPQPIDTVVLDVDGTLVDTVYQHTMAWSAGFAAVGVEVPIFRIHRAIGMGSDLLVAEVAGQVVEERCGDEVRRLHGEGFDEALKNVRALPGAADLLAELRRRGFKVALASSGEPEQTKQLMDLFEGHEHVQHATTGSDVSNSKPAPDLIEAAIEQVGGHGAVVIGDAVWDVSAAAKGGHGSIGLLCGGFGEGELREAGADDVFATPQDLLDALDRTPLRQPG